MRAHGVDMAAFPPVVMSMIVTSLARIVLLERGLGITRGHAEAEAFIEHYLERFELPRRDLGRDPNRMLIPVVSSSTITCYNLWRVRTYTG